MIATVALPSFFFFFSREKGEIGQTDRKGRRKVEKGIGNDGWMKGDIVGSIAQRWSGIAVGVLR